MFRRIVSSLRGRCLCRCVLGIGLLGSALFAYGAAAQNAPRIQVSGEAMVLAVDDFETHESETQYYVREAQAGIVRQVRFLDRAPETFRTGASVTVSGALRAGQIEAGGADVRLTKPGPIAPLASVSQTTAAPVQFAQRAIIILLNFTDRAAVCSTNSCDTNVFGQSNSVQSLYKEASHGNISYTGTTVGPFTIAVSTTTPCPSPYLPTFEQWAALADTQAQNAGIDLSGYTEKVYVLPAYDPCGSQRGYATIGGSPGMAWISVCQDPEVYAHEMGHNLGMHHAGVAANEYGDLSDIMGSTTVGMRGLNAAHRDQFNWLPPGNLVNVAAGGAYTLAPLEIMPAQTSLPQALKILKADTNEFYYFSYRQPVGYDTLLPSFNSGIYTGGVNVHRFAGPSANNIHTYFLQALSDGESFTDTVNNITITQISHDSSGAKLKVAMGGSAADVSPANISFGNEAVGSTTASQIVTLNNPGGAALSISSVGLTGTNGGDFRLSANNCGSSLPPGATCSVAVAFAPTAEGNRSAFLSIADAVGTQEVALNGNGVVPDFTLSASGQSSVTVNAGTPATFGLNVGATNGFSGNINVSCALMAADATCSANPASVAAGGSTRITVTTMAHQLVPTNPSRRFPNGLWLRFVLLLIGAGLMLLMWSVGTRVRRLRFVFAIPMVAGVFLSTMYMSGCAGGNSTKATAPPPSSQGAFGTQAGTYTVNITGTSGGMTHTTTMTLVIN